MEKGMKKKGKKYLNRMMNGRFLFVPILCGILPLILFACISYELSRRTILNNAMKDLHNVVKKNNEIIEIQLERVEESALIFTVDQSLSACLTEELPKAQSKLLHRNLELKRIMDRYFLSIPGIFAYHLCTDRYMMAGNYPDAAISNYKPSMYVPYREFLDSELCQWAVAAKGQLVWASTYSYEEMYGMEEYKKIQYDYPWLFSAVKQINCFMEEEGRFNPILIVSYTPDFLGDIFESSEFTAMDDAVCYLVDGEGQIVYGKEKEMLGLSFQEIYGKLFPEESGYEKLSIRGKEYIAAYDTQNLTGWKQIALVPTRTYIGPVKILPQMLLLIALASTLFLIFFPRMYKLVIENYEIRLREKEAQIMALNLQINPHFLYNTLNTINMMAIGNGQEEISEALISLAQMLQKTLKMNEDTCTVREEVENLKDYLYIMKLRYEDAFTVSIQIDDKVMDSFVPRLMLQPLVENSVIHGFDDRESGGEIEIRGWMEEDGKRCFQISDNGKGYEIQEDNDKKGHLGLNNLKNRLYLLYGDDYFMEIGPKIGGGTVVYIVLPTK